jgi:1,4-alpha-glucan branching enzyme
VPPPTKKASSFLTFTLHSHLPYVVNHGTWPHGMEWLHEAAAETYLPLLRMFRRLEKDGLALRANINFTPILLEQLTHPVFKREFSGYVLRKIQAAKEDEAFFGQSGEPHFAETARFWQDYYQQALDDFRELGEDIVGGFRYFHNKGMIELITCGATHGYFPLLGTDESIHAQVQMAVRTHRRHIGQSPRGIWTPECGYRPAGVWQAPVPEAGHDEPWPAFYRHGVEEFLAAGGINFFHVDTTLIDRAISFTPSAKRYSPYELMQKSVELLANNPAAADDTVRAVAEDHSAAEAVASGINQSAALAELQAQAEHRTFYQPYDADGPDSRKHPVAAFPRDPKTGVQVWSGDAGYPGDALYLDFHKKRWPGGHRYWQVTGSKVDMAYKTPYYPQEAAQRTRSHAEHYVSLVYDALKDGFLDEKPPILCSPFDAELFGHWWFEGPLFLEQIVRVLAEAGPEYPVQLINGSAYLARYGAAGFLSLPEGSWGKNGTNEVWLNPETSWTWPHIYAAEHTVRDIATSRKWAEGYDANHDFSGEHHFTQFPRGNVRISKPSQAELEGKEDSEGRPIVAQAATETAEVNAAVQELVPAATHHGETSAAYIAKSAPAPKPETKYVPDLPPVVKAEGHTNDTLPLRIMKQMCRELLLMESSDWQFLITTQAAKDYAEERFVTHTDQFNQVHAIWKHWEQHGSITEEQMQQLAYLEERDSVFPDIDPSLWERRFAEK